jgi:hypothetical protein
MDSHRATLRIAVHATIARDASLLALTVRPRSAGLEPTL